MVPDSVDHVETVLFEVPDFALCLRLYQRLRQAWPAWLVGQSESRFVAVSVVQQSAAMEDLLRTVAEWASEVGLPSVAFHVGEQMSVVFAKESDDISL